MSDETWILIGDLHLEAEGPDPRGVSSELPSFIRATVGGGGPGTHLVLLGDSFEINGTARDPAVRASDAAARLEAVGRRFEEVFASLREFLDADGRLHIVCGNHDSDLMRPLVRERVAVLLDVRDAIDDRLQVHPWVLHRRGLLYAEHGHQHHQLNRTPRLLEAVNGHEARCAPPTALAEYADLRQRGARPLALAGAMTRALREADHSERAAAAPEYLDLIGEAARAADLPAEALQRVHRVSAFRPAGACISSAARVVGRRIGVSANDGYLRQAARRIDSVLAEAGPRPHCYVFGHTHTAALEALGEGGPYYANTGTWSPDVRGGDVAGFPYVRVWSGSDGHHVELAEWQAQPGRAPTTGGTQRDPGSTLAGCQRIVVLGRTGSGKTTLARQLAASRGVPHVELDSLYFGADLSTVPLPVLRQRTMDAVAGDRWVTDGNKSAVRDLVWPRADTVVWLDYPWRVSLWRLGKRALRRTSTLAVSAAGDGDGGALFPQLFAASKGVLTALRSHRGQRGEFPRLFAQAENRHLAVVRLRSSRATRTWLERVHST